MIQSFYFLGRTLKQRSDLQGTMVVEHHELNGEHLILSCDSTDSVVCRGVTVVMVSVFSAGVCSAHLSNALYCSGMHLTSLGFITWFWSLNPLIMLT